MVLDCFIQCAAQTPCPVASNPVSVTLLAKHKVSVCRNPTGSHNQEPLRRLVVFCCTPYLVVWGFAGLFLF